jgi:putative ATPase
MQQESFLNKHIPPLAERMRPKNLKDFVGQEHLLEENQFFYKAIEKDSFGSCLFWGPPGSGKTSLAKVIASTTQRVFVSFNAVFQGVKDLRQIIDEAKKRISGGGRSTVLFVDEIHRFNKAQQDSFLHPIENGIIILIGATTENPSFEMNSALLSRCAIYVLNMLESNHIAQIVERTLEDKRNGFGNVDICLEDNAKDFLTNYSNGDARVALNALENAVQTTGQKNNFEKKVITKKIIQKAITSRRISYDKQGEEYYNLISALHKSMRGSDVQAALYWLARMIEGGADPLYVSRRLVRFASEDIGLADPQALNQAITAKEAVHFLGYPECDTVLAQCVIYLATAPKSNKSYEAIKSAKNSVKETSNEPVPLNIRNAPTKFMKKQGYGKNYQYDHDAENCFTAQNFLPKSLGDIKFYIPGEYGFERDIKKRIEYWNKLKKIKLKKN